MNRQPYVGSIVAIGALGLGLSLASPASAQPVIEVVAPPPPAVIATVQPVYYEGHPAYWYGGHWYWRDPHGWHSYGAEPAYLRDHRMHAPPRAYHYERRRR